MKTPDHDGYEAPDLGDVPSDVLLYELSKRYDVCVFAYTTNLNATEYQYNAEMGGPGIYCLGLLEWAAATEKARLVAQHQKAPNRDDEEKEL